MKIFKYLISAVYPNKCMGCGDIIDEEKTLCNICEAKIERNCLEDLCLNCGFEKDECVCNFNIYRFDKLISVFKNDGIAQRANYRYKFNRLRHYVNFFAKEMSEAVKILYGDVSFDFICSVPSNRGFFNNTHYNHCEYIASAMSNELGLPYVKDVLYCRKSSKLQHKSTIKERLVNVEGKYDYNFRIDGKTVLLVDDIRTTGATLEECSKMLLYAGADAVYCVTALCTKIKSEKEN